jgi:hypothetical protein
MIMREFGIRMSSWSSLWTSVYVFWYLLELFRLLVSLSLAHTELLKDQCTVNTIGICMHAIIWLLEQPNCCWNMLLNFLSLVFSVGEFSVAQALHVFWQLFSSKLWQCNWLIYWSMFLCRRMGGGREGEITMVDRWARRARSAAAVSA